MMSHRVVSDNGLKALHDGCSISIRVPWYRSLPLSVFEVMEVTLDGQVVPLEQVQFSIEGEIFPLSELAKRTDEVWYVLDDAYLKVAGVDVAQGSQHDVAVTLAIYPPYIKGYKRITRTQKHLTAR